jgi:serine/threonine protein phosphatase PrpC
MMHPDCNIWYSVTSERYNQGSATAKCLSLTKKPPGPKSNGKRTHAGVTALYALLMAGTLWVSILSCALRPRRQPAAVAEGSSEYNDNPLIAGTDSTGAVIHVQEATAGDDSGLSERGGKLLRCYEFGCVLIPYDFHSDADAMSIVEQQREPPSSILHKSTPELGMVTRHGTKRDVNQDRALFIRPFLVGPDSETSSSNFLLAIFDGHSQSGHEVSSFLLTHFPSLLASNLNSNGSRFPEDENTWIRGQLNKTFLEIQDQIPLAAAYRGGSTGCVVLRMGQRLFVANVGDSQVVVTQHSTALDAASTNAPASSSRRRLSTVPSQLDPIIIYRSALHKTHYPEELSRIQKAGGEVTFPDNGRSPRVWAFCKHMDPPYTKGLTMSRSFGDNDFKGIGVIAEPTIDMIDLPFHNHTGVGEDADAITDSLLLVAATDGLWELHKDTQATGIPLPLDRLLRLSNASSSHPLRAIVDTIEDLSPTKHRDDITVVTVRLFR